MDRKVPNDLLLSPSRGVAKSSPNRAPRTPVGRISGVFRRASLAQKRQKRLSDMFDQQRTPTKEGPSSTTENTGDLFNQQPTPTKNGGFAQTGEKVRKDVSALLGASSVQFNGLGAASENTGVKNG